MDQYLQHYNTKRPHQGRLMQDHAPYQAFTDSLPQPEKTAKKEVVKKKKVA